MKRMLLSCGLVAGPLFAVLVLVQQAAKGGGYDPMRHPVSSLALGDSGWLQTANFLVTGVLTVAFAAGLWRSGRGSRLGAVLVGVWGVGLLGAGIFVSDPVSGFPAGTPPTIEYTTSGLLHDGFSLPGFLALAVAQLVISRGRDRRWLVYSLLSAMAYTGCLLVASAGFGQAETLVGVAGLFQRLTVVIGWTWTVLLAIQVRRG